MAAKEAVVVLADRAQPQTCAFRAVSQYIAAARLLKWDLQQGYLFPEVSKDGSRSNRPLTAARMTSTLQASLTAAELPNHFTMHPFRVGGSLSKSLEGTAVKEIMQIAGWKTEAMARHYIGPTVGPAGSRSKSKLDHEYSHADRSPLDSGFQRRFAACL